MNVVDLFALLPLSWRGLDSTVMSSRQMGAMLLIMVESFRDRLAAMALPGALADATGGAAVHFGIPLSRDLAFSFRLRHLDAADEVTRPLLEVLGSLPRKEGSLGRSGWRSFGRIVSGWRKARGTDTDDLTTARLGAAMKRFAADLRNAVGRPDDLMLCTFVAAAMVLMRTSKADNLTMSAENIVMGAREIGSFVLDVRIEGDEQTSTHRAQVASSVQGEAAAHMLESGLAAGVSFQMSKVPGQDWSVESMSATPVTAPAGAG